jgi:TolB protein
VQNFYTVRAGDTLILIARRWGIPVESLVAANRLVPPYTIYVGQQLSIPPGVNVIRVREGDTVYKISQEFGVPSSVIIQANQLVPPYVIQVGQLLTVPPGVPYYMVQPGDSLFQIARGFNVVTGNAVNVGLLKEVNKLTSDLITVGMRLVIPYAPPGVSGLVAYVSNVSGHYDIWLYNPMNGTNVQVTTGLAESFSYPFWSPDSSNIAFIGTNNILYVVSPADNRVMRIDQFTESLGVFLDWSPDSQSLVYTKPEGIILYNVVTHQALRLNQPNATDAQWFPNGQELLFQALDEQGISQLFRIRSNGTQRIQITQNKGGPYNFVRLSPDGRFILYTSPGASISIIYTIELSTGRVSEVRGGPLAKNYFPAWSPDSTTIAFSATAYEDRGYFSQIRTSTREGGNDVTRAISNCFASPVTWSTDGRSLAYLSDCKPDGTASEIWFLTLSHPVPIKLVDGGAITSLQWSPKPIQLSKKTLRSERFQVQLQYPANWQQVEEERFEGTDGFFQFSAIASNEEIGIVCHNEAFHQLLPYGSQPRIIQTQIEQQPACYIYPSADQPPEMKRQAALIIRYPTPITINGTTYHYFILWADQPHINEIGQTVTFGSRGQVPRPTLR